MGKARQPGYTALVRSRTGFRHEISLQIRRSRTISVYVFNIGLPWDSLIALPRPTQPLKPRVSSADHPNMFEWSDEFGIGISSIDAQHRALFGIARELHTAMAGGQAKTV